MANEAIYNCQGCGACCADSERGEGYAFLSRAESKRMRRLGLHVIIDTGGSRLGTRVHPRENNDWVCVAFQGQVGCGCACSIYPDRPAVCRRFQVGSLLCRRARAEAGLPLN